jgi:cell shape-determining protein MreC
MNSIDNQNYIISKEKKFCENEILKKFLAKVEKLEEKIEKLEKENKELKNEKIQKKSMMAPIIITTPIVITKPIILY